MSITKSIYRFDAHIFYMSQKQDLSMKRTLKKKNHNKCDERIEPLQKGKFDEHKQDKTHSDENKERTLKLKKFRERKTHEITYEE